MNLYKWKYNAAKNYFNVFTTRGGAFGNNMEKEPHQLRPNLKTMYIIVCYIFTENICSACNPMKVVDFLQKCINFVERRLKLSHFECSIIPSHCSSFVKHGDSASMSVARAIWTFKGYVNSIPSSAISTVASCNSDSNEETYSVNKTCWQ